MKKLFKLCIVVLFAISLTTVFAQNKKQSKKAENSVGQFTNAEAFGFLPENTGIDNSQALQKAVDQGGTIIVSKPGTYKVAATVYVGSHTSLIFGNGVFLKKVDEKGLFSHVLINKGALSKTYDESIRIEGLHIIVNGIDKTFDEVYGLRGQIAFFYIKDLRIEGFRCLDLTKMQFGIHVCTFEDLIINDVIIKGNKDGVHLGRGKRFLISNGVFQTFDDAIALNGHDYATSNPELGWIENGVIENCHDLDQENTTGYFCRILAGGWKGWHAGMEVQQSDAVVSNGKIYRVQMQPDGKVYTSKTRPSHSSGTAELDGIKWGVVQNDVIYTAGVRNVVFRNIFLEKPRIAFSIHFDNDKYSRSYYPGSEIPRQENITFDNIIIMHNENKPFLTINTPVDVVSITNSSFRDNSIIFRGNKAMVDYQKTRINMMGNVFHYPQTFNLLQNTVKGKKIEIRLNANMIMSENFKASIIEGEGILEVFSDIPVVKK
ncbi:MAG: hypothetical protein JJU28_06025 [Cyclobacteriaceae bacterium]|nr:hypothetical protein [Cyclobacteriaceae bacterium]